MVQPFVASVAFVEQQVIVAVVDTLVAAVAEPPEVVPVCVLLALPWDQVVQQLEHVLEIAVVELPWLSGVVLLQCHLLVQFVSLRALLGQPAFELVGQLLEEPEPPAIVELKQTRLSLAQYLVVVRGGGFCDSAAFAWTGWEDLDLFLSSSCLSASCCRDEEEESLLLLSLDDLCSPCLLLDRDLFSSSDELRLRR